jgi:hypothetical protein
MRREGSLKTLAILGLVAAAGVGSIIYVTVRSHHGSEATLRIVGREEVVFDWSEDACEPSDVPDLPARAFRDDRGRVQLIASHYVARRFVGPDLDGLRHECVPVFESRESPDPAAFSDREWIGSVYTLDGSTIFALLHAEYQGNTHPGRCPSGEYLECWYNAITLAVSRDGGVSYERVTEPPGHLVASIPSRYRPDGGSAGIFSPSNIVRSPEDGRYYALVRVAGYGNEPYGTCVMRTERLDRPDSWRAWGGDGFTVEFSNPYREGDVRPSSWCEPVAPADIAAMTDSLTRNSVAGKYLLVGVSSLEDQASGRTVWGVYYSFSEDLVTWTPRRLLLETETVHSYECGDPDPIAYASLIDPASRSRSFETTGRRGFLYFTRFNVDADCDLGLDRDLVRVPVEID